MARPNRRGLTPEEGVISKGEISRRDLDTVGKESIFIYVFALHSVQVPAQTLRAAGPGMGQEVTSTDNHPNEARVERLLTA